MRTEEGVERGGRQDVVEAKKFIVIDENGKTRVILGALEDRTDLFLYSPNGNVWQAPP